MNYLDLFGKVQAKCKITLRVENNETDCTLRKGGAAEPQVEYITLSLDE